MRTGELALVLILLASWGCGQSGDRQEQAQAPREDTAAPRDEHHWQDQVSAMDRARQVEHVLQEDAERKRRQLQDQED